MNLRSKDTYLDSLLRQAMQPYAHVRPPEAVWRRVSRRIWEGVPGRWHGLFSWLWSPFIAQRHLSHQPSYFEVGGRCTPSPFLGVMVKQMLDLRLAS